MQTSGGKAPSTEWLIRALNEFETVSLVTIRVAESAQQEDHSSRKPFNQKGQRLRYEASLPWARRKNMPFRRLR